MTLVSGVAASASSVSPSAVQATATGVPVAAPQVSFGTLLARSAVVGQAAKASMPFSPPRVPCVSAPTASCRATTIGGSEELERSNPTQRRWAKGEPFDFLSRRYLGHSSELAGWLSSERAVATPPVTGGGGAEEAVRGAVSLEELLPTLVRRVAWSSEGKRGTARLEIGSGDLAGATLLVHADAGRVRVQLAVPPGSDAQSWRDRIVRRLAARDIPVDEVEVS